MNQLSNTNRFLIKSKGPCTNPLIRFDPIRGLAVGLVRRYPLMRPNRRVDRIQLPSKMAIASSTEAPSQMMAWHAAVIRTASSVVF